MVSFRSIEVILTVHACIYVFKAAGNMAGAKKNRSAVYLCLWNAGAVWPAEPGA